MKRSMVGLVALVLLAGGIRPAMADIVFDNGPVSGAIGSWGINQGYAVSDSFTVSSPATLSSVVAGFWVDQGASPTSVSWSIGTSPFAHDVSSGTSSTIDTFRGADTFLGTYDVYSVAFNISGVVTPGTTYYLTLSDAGVLNGSFVGWDENDGTSSTDYHQSLNGTEVSQPNGSESFTIYSTPEPSTQILVALGALGLVGHGWRRRRAA